MSISGLTLDATKNSNPQNHSILHTMTEQKVSEIGQEKLNVENRVENLSISKIDEGHTFLYLPPEEIQHIGLVKSKESYQDAISQLPICCVDVFLFNQVNRTYLLVLRKDPPAKGVYWLPGGRLYKGESFFECSKRKCKEEVGLDVTPIQSLDFAATIFPDSMWNTQTHTVNFIIFAKMSENKNPTIDKTCQDYQWKALDEKPDDPYVQNAYQKALEIIKKLEL